MLQGNVALEDLCSFKPIVANSASQYCQKKGSHQPLHTKETVQPRQYDSGPSKFMNTNTAPIHIGATTANAFYPAEVFPNRVISPFSSTESKEETEERGDLSESWDQRETDDEEVDTSIVIDCNIFFEGEYIGNTDDLMETCDEFSISSREASDISDDVGFVLDRAAFWEAGAQAVDTQVCFDATFAGSKCL